MSSDAPKTAPKTAPKHWAKSGEPPAEWKDHWHTNYHDPRVVQYRGKYAIAVTLPKALQKQTEFDKKLSARTTDKKVAEERKWKIAAKIYTKFDEALGDIDPQIARDEDFRTKAIKLLAKRGVKSPQITEGIKGDFFEPDDLVRYLHTLGITIPDDMIDLLSEEAKFYATHLPSIDEQSEADKATVSMFGSRDSNAKDALKQISKGIEFHLANPDAPYAKLIQSGTIGLLKEFPYKPTELDKELSERLKSGKSTKVSSTIADVSKRYIAENRWRRDRTKSGAKLALKRFCDLHGSTTDIKEINAKHAYAFAKWMEDELDSASKSIKGALSYVKGMFSWAVTQVDYDITDEPWGVLKKIGNYGSASEQSVPFTEEQLAELFSLIHRTGTGKMNRREHLILSILIATGCRLDEAALLCWENIIQHENGWYFIDLTKALVKNQGSKRLLPIPESLWPLFPPRGYQLTVEGLRESSDDRLFDYSLDSDGKAARAASQACGRQLRKIEREGRQVTHSLRGNLKDLLRDAGVSKELNDYITGHGQGDVAGDRYGKGHTVELRYEALNKVEHPWVQNYPE